MGEYHKQSPLEVLPIEKLPPLKDGYVRLVHITVPELASRTKTQGLDYRRHGMISSTARWWGDANKCEYWSDDPRFSFAGAVAVVMDVPMDEIRMHNNPAKSSGIIPPEYFVGIVEAKEPLKK